MRGESRPIKGLGPYNVWEVAVGLLALGIAGMALGLVDALVSQTLVSLPLLGGVVLFVAGLIVLRWDLAHRG